MSDTRKPFACPGCSKTVKVPLKHLGKRIKCPKCSYVFRAGPKQTEEEIYAELDEDDFGLPAHVPAAQLVQPVQYARPVAPVHALPPSPRPRQQFSSHKPSRTKQQRNKSIEMTEAESYCQSSGLFLIALPAIATVLPLFGLQLRRLAKAGEFAPLAAMFLGLIGVGMICYARRRQGDAPLLGSAAAGLVLVTGIGGFFLVASLGGGSDNNSDVANERDRFQPAMTQQLDPEIEEQMNADIEFFHESRKKSRESMRQQSSEMERQFAEDQRQFENEIRQMATQNQQMLDAQQKAMKAQEDAVRNMGRPNSPSGSRGFPSRPNFSPPKVPTGPNFSPPGFPGGRSNGFGNRN